MKKLIWIYLMIILVGCEPHGPEKTIIKPIVQEPEVRVQKAEVVFIDQKLLEHFIAESNKITNIIELEYLHDKMINDLLSAVDLNQPIEEQEDIIDDIVMKYLDIWKDDIVRNMIAELETYVPEDDIQTIISRTSVVDAHQIMLAYEKIFLRNYKD